MRARVHVAQRATTEQMGSGGQTRALSSSSPPLQASRSSRKGIAFGKRSNSMKRNPNAAVTKSGWLYKQVPQPRRAPSQRGAPPSGCVLPASHCSSLAGQLGGEAVEQALVRAGGPLPLLLQRYNVCGQSCFCRCLLLWVLAFVGARFCGCTLLWVHAFMGVSASAGACFLWPCAFVGACFLQVFLLFAGACFLRVLTFMGACSCGCSPCWGTEGLMLFARLLAAHSAQLSLAAEGEHELLSRLAY